MVRNLKTVGHGLPFLYQNRIMRRTVTVVWCLLFLCVPLVLLLVADSNRGPGGTPALSTSIFTAGMASLGFLIFLSLVYLIILYVYFKRAFGDTLKAIKSHELAQESNPETRLMHTSLRRVGPCPPISSGYQN